ncbi:inhibitor of apoptosis repeat-containing protein [Massarina eburnea CBS 473.64]|uniref:Inhibitor of apoptosis repeat-containing protein n=1 Tax=Massarina eburnea CBS 473.64 TaxID=1395130 RepID=A0A6A6S5H6_9PLEO|nr:inhibitor of apoptosis repeat-containing protein [Massarina eburnea CBS 473.64]
MDGTYASQQARLETFAPPKTKSRRNSTRGKKPAPKAAQKGGWPLAAPTPDDLAYAGFVFAPTSVSHDNVQCFSCQTQLDGWEESDTPAFEHLTHSPNCGFAINVCIRLRSGLNDPGRTEDDPLSEGMLEARRNTFANLWPLDEAEGFPGVEQMIRAGWYYDPMEDAPDGVTCPYCALSLDAWDAGDDPTEEHRRRSSDCLFFTLNELYRPTQKPKKAARAKRSSTRSSTASKTTTRTKKAAAKEKPLPHPPSDYVSTNLDQVSDFTKGNFIASTPKNEPKELVRKTRKAPARTSTASVASNRVVSDFTKGNFIESTPESEPEKEATRKRKVPARSPTLSAASDRLNVDKISDFSKDNNFIASTPEDEPKKEPARKTRKAPARTSTSSVAASVASTRSTRQNNKRTSEVLDDEDEPEAAPASPKRARVSDLTRSFIASTPREEPKDSGSYPKTPATPTTPEGPPPGTGWEPTNMDEFFDKSGELFRVVSNMIIDSGLDKENVNMEEAPAVLAESIKQRLTDPEKQMTVEEWVLYNAKRGEEQLRVECERQILAFEAQGRRALAAIDA